MSSRVPAEITRQNLGPFEPNALLPEEQFLRTTIDAMDGSVSTATVSDLVNNVANFDEQHRLISATPFSYLGTPELPEYDLVSSPEQTVQKAIANLHEHTGRYDARAFAMKSDGLQLRKERELQWRAPMDEDFEIRVRGGSGSGTLSIDIGIGVYDQERPWRYGELWRTGVDTIRGGDNELGARFVRTGSGLKRDDEVKTLAFNKFRRRFNMLPQRMLGIIGLYYMRELDPSFALALTTTGAKHLSTLGKSSGKCDYTGIFRNIGFMPTQDPNWLVIDDFGNGFYEALQKANVRRKEGDSLNTAVLALNQMNAIDGAGNPIEVDQPFVLCSNASRMILSKEVNAHIQ